MVHAECTYGARRMQGSVFDKCFESAATLVIFLMNVIQTENMFVGPPAQVAIFILALSEVVSSRLPKGKRVTFSRNAVQGGAQGGTAYEYSYEDVSPQHKHNTDNRTHTV